ncbi:MAG: hypothetical protein H6707_02495 [Deltaproteobacteria bacterium]|nr:hypothetical protein [Deltaproteobacteria bacterium]
MAIFLVAWAGCGAPHSARPVGWVASSGADRVGAEATAATMTALPRWMCHYRSSRVQGLLRDLPLRLHWDGPDVAKLNYYGRSAEAWLYQGDPFPGARLRFYGGILRFTAYARPARATMVTPSAPVLCKAGVVALNGARLTVLSTNRTSLLMQCPLPTAYTPTNLVSTVALQCEETKLGPDQLSAEHQWRRYGLPDKYADGYLAKDKPVDVYAAPNGEQLGTLRAAYTLKLRRIEDRGAFTRVIYQTGNSAIDGWIKTTALHAEPAVGGGGLGVGSILGMLSGGKRRDGFRCPQSLALHISGLHSGKGRRYALGLLSPGVFFAPSTGGLARFRSVDVPQLSWLKPLDGWRFEVAQDELEQAGCQPQSALQ